MRGVIVFTEGGTFGKKSIQYRNFKYIVTWFIES